MLSNYLTVKQSKVGMIGTNKALRCFVIFNLNVLLKNCPGVGVLEVARTNHVNAIFLVGKLSAEENNSACTFC